MSDIFKVYLVSSSFHTCFFYRNEVDSHKENVGLKGIKINYGKDYKFVTYGSFYQQVLPEVPNRCIGICTLYAEKLGLKENDNVLVSYCDLESIKLLQIIPRKEEDYIIVLTCKNILETHLLSQVRVVTEGQILPIYVFSNIAIDLRIGKLESTYNYGQLEKFTEIVISHPAEVLWKNHNFSRIACANDEHNKNMLSNSAKYFELISDCLNNSCKSNMEEIEKIQKHENLVSGLLTNKKQGHINYVVFPNIFVTDNEFPEHIKNKCIIVSNFENHEKSYGPFCTKAFCKIQRIRSADSKKSNSCENGDDSSNDIISTNKEQPPISVYAFVVSLNNGCHKCAFCPSHIMKKLNIFAGAKLTIEKTELKLSLIAAPNQSEEDEFRNYFWDGAASIRENAILTVLNNLRTKCKVNTLILGSLRVGKTFLLESIGKEFSNMFIYTKMISCKSLKGKKIETLQKLWGETLLECSGQEPALLILDDLHVLTSVDNAEGEFNKLYSNRVVNLISEYLMNFQRKHDISVIASAVGTSQLSSIISRFGSSLFSNVYKIPEMKPVERKDALKNMLIGCHASKNINGQLIDLDFVAEKTNGFTVQDISDLLQKSIFKCILRNNFIKNKLYTLSNDDFESALSETTPFNLRGVRLKEKSNVSWEAVGGMEKQKKILTEVFSWPSKYPRLLESCPLRLQKGVLLYGVPGTGKTLVAGALANKCGLNLISVKGPELLSKYVGESEEGVRNLFSRAQKTQPCLLFFDEFDSLAPKRGHDSTGVTDRVVNQLLTQLDGVETSNGVWVLAATSRPDLLDPALLRPGRLDKLVFCEVPNQVDRLSILEALSENLNVSSDVDFSEIAEKSDGYTGADLQAVLYNAQISAIRKRKEDGLENDGPRQIEQEDLFNALAETKPSLTSAEKIKYEKIYGKFLDSRQRNLTNRYTELTQKITLA